jgi:hypothetical protein
VGFRCLAFIKVKENKYSFLIEKVPENGHKTMGLDLSLNQDPVSGVRD